MALEYLWRDNLVDFNYLDPAEGWEDSWGEKRVD